MSNEKELQNSLEIQIKLFQSTKRLNLSENYEAIPKEVYNNDPIIKWVSKYIARPVEKTFSINGKSYVSKIFPANFKNNKTEQFRSHFPNLREARIEYAIISSVTKQLVYIDTDSKHRKTFSLRTTYYQIQKEIIEAINVRKGKKLKPNEWGSQKMSNLAVPDLAGFYSKQPQARKVHSTIHMESFMLA